MTVSPTAQVTAVEASTTAQTEKRRLHAEVRCQCMCSAGVAVVGVVVVCGWLLRHNFCQLKI